MIVSLTSGDAQASAGTVVASRDLDYYPNGNRSRDTVKVMNADNVSAYLDTVPTVRPLPGEATIDGRG